MVSDTERLKFWLGLACFINAFAVILLFVLVLGYTPRHNHLQAFTLEDGRKLSLVQAISRSDSKINEIIDYVELLEIRIKVLETFLSRR